MSLRPSVHSSLLLISTRKALHGLAPEYLRELLVIRNPGRALRSAAAIILEVPERLKKDRDFSAAKRTKKY